MPVPVRKGFAFLGWFTQDGTMATDAQGNASITLKLSDKSLLFPMANNVEAPLSIDENTVLIAHWKAIDASSSTSNSGDATSTKDTAGTVANDAVNTGKTNVSPADATGSTGLTKNYAVFSGGGSTTSAPRAAASESSSANALPATADNTNVGGFTFAALLGMGAVVGGMILRKRQHTKDSDLM